MIYVCKEFALNNSSSVAKLIKYLGKTNQDLVITPKTDLEHPSKERTAQARGCQVSSTAGLSTENGRSSFQTPLKLCKLPAGSLVRTWSRNHTLMIKKRLEGSGLSIISLTRDGDLGIRSTKEAVPIGVILKVSYNLSNSTRARQRTVMCYALTYTGYEAVSNAKYLLADYEADWLFFINQTGKWQLLTK